MTDLMTNLAPLGALLFVAACVLWLVWRAIRGLFRSPGRGVKVPAPQAFDHSRREPGLSLSGQLSPAVPDAADVLALKASIDALARQVSLLEKRLAPANSNEPVSVPARQAAAPVEPEKPRTAPITEVPLVVPDHRI